MEKCLCSTNYWFGTFCPFVSAAGNRAAEEREADVGAASALGRDEGGVRRPAVPPVVQPFRRTETAAPPDDPLPEGRLRVRRLIRESSRFSARQRAC